MQWTPAKAILAVAGIATLGAGGYQMNHAITCQGLEDDYLNSISLMKNGVLAAGFLNDNEIAKDLAELRELQLLKAKSALNSLYEQCGERAGQTASRKGSELLTD